MINRKNFIPKSLIQPDRYEYIFNNWNAIYKTKKGDIFYIEIISDYHENKKGKWLQILKRCPMYRILLEDKIPSIKKAVSMVENLM